MYKIKRKFYIFVIVIVVIFTFTILEIVKNGETILTSSVRCIST